MPVMETFDAVSSGMLKIDFSYGPYWIGKLPMAIYASGIPPFTLTRWEQYKVMYYELGLEKLIREAYAKHNIFYVAAMPTNNAVMLGKFPVHKAADLKGKKFRATGLYAEVLNEAGASATYFPWGEIYGALEKGTIDGVKKAMEEELKEKQRLEEEEAARKKAEAEGPSLEDIPSDELIDLIDSVREIMEFSDQEKEIRVMCEQSSIPKALVDIAVSEPDRLDELEKEAEG